MGGVPLPVNEEKRVDALHSLGVLDTPHEERFDRITRLARRLFDVPIALVSLIDTERQWMKSNPGLDVRETSRDDSFCARAILQDDVMTVPNALEDERFHDNPYVQGAPHVRFYAGCPLTVGAGINVGTLCLIDVKARTFSLEERELLRDLARLATQELQAMQLATIDELTGISNRRGFHLLAERVLRASHAMGQRACLLFFDLDGFKAINDAFGHAEGDRALARFADVLRATFREGDVVARLGGDEFVALLPLTSGESAVAAAERLRAALEQREAVEPRGYPIRYSVGHVECDSRAGASIPDLLAAADAAMYANKQPGARR